MLHPQINGGLNLHISSLCQQAGFSPTVAQFVINTWAPLALSAARMGVGVVYASLMTKISLEGVRTIPIAASLEGRSIYVASTQNASPAARQFIDQLVGKPGPVA
jgi:DNA-binding transcriptional LysR family regulator